MKTNLVCDGCIRCKRRITAKGDSRFYFKVMPSWLIAARGRSILQNNWPEFLSH